MASIDEVLGELALSLSTYTRDGMIGGEFASDVTIIDDSTNTIGLELEDGTRFFITVEAVD